VHIIKTKNIYFEFILQLYARDIIDVGTVISDEKIELFLQRCYFGEDSEDSVAMALTESGKARWLLNGEQMIEEILKKKEEIEEERRKKE
jgi:hypothetical protein